MARRRSAGWWGLLAQVLLACACGGGGAGGSGGTGDVLCYPGEVDCGDRCVDPLTDREHCGASAGCTGAAAGTACADGAYCVDGECALGCPDGQYGCDGRCIDPASDPLYCGAGPDCTGGQACGEGTFCSAGDCWAPCQAGRVLCDGQCVDPTTSAAHCGAGGLCQGADAGAACRSDQVCSGGACACPSGRVACGAACVDPLAADAHCGASGDCTGAAAGVACGAAQACLQGSCLDLQEIDWRPAPPASRPPHFPEDEATLVHLTFDGASGRMDDSTGHTAWTAVGSPGAVESGMWSPAQWASGPFSAGAHWVGSAASRDWLNGATTGDFTVCARYAPGAHPGAGPTKVVMAAGRPETAGGAGWALLRRHAADNFTYHDATADGVWMAYSVWGLDAAAVAALAWTWQCGGRDGTLVRLQREGFDSGGYVLPALGQPAAPLGDFLPSADLPTLGAYADGSSPLDDGAIYEVLVSAEAATDAAMRNLIARAAGGLAMGNEGGRLLAGADGALHLGAPGTVPVREDGGVAATGEVVLGGHLSTDPGPGGSCLGLTAASADWSALGPAVVPLAWQGSDPASRVEVRWEAAGTSACVHVDHAGGEAYACGAPPALVAGSTHTFLHCVSAADGRLRVYLDGSLTPLATSAAALAPEQRPRLDDRLATLALQPVLADLVVYRVFGCPTGDPAACR